MIKSILRVCAGLTMLSAVILVPLILEYGIKTVSFYTAGVSFLVAWIIGGIILFSWGISGD